MVELHIDNKAIELRNDADFQFNYTIGDIFEIARIQVSYSNSFQVPLSPNNIHTMQGLGLVGNNSPVPYRKTSVNVKYDGFDIVNNGWLDVQETSDSYRLTIREGILDFWKGIENKTIGNDLDISTLDHEKNVDNFTYSIMDPSSPYVYVTAGFGGKMQLPDNVINIDYLIPVVKLSYFWNKIFDTFGYTYSGSIFSDPDFTDACITYPKAPEADPDNIVVEIIANALKNTSTDNNPVLLPGGKYHFPNSYVWSTSSSMEGEWLNDWQFRADANGTYRFRTNPVGYVTEDNPNSPLDINAPYHLEVIVKGQVIKSFISRAVYDEDEYQIFDFPLEEGDIVDFRITRNQSAIYEVESLFSNIVMEVYKTSLDRIDFTGAFSDFALTDFVREIMIRYGLTAVYDAYTKNIHFYTTEERMNFDNYVNWTDKYAQRTKESYLFNSYAQRNIFAHKYNDQGDSFNNGQLRVNNQNLEFSKLIFESKTYSPENGFRTLAIGSNEIQTPVYPLWRSEIKEVVENNQNVTKIEYKGFSDRYYIMKLKTVNETGYFKSEILSSNVQTTPHFYIPDNANANFVDLVPKYYGTYERRVFSNFKMHTIELALSLPDVLQLDFTKLYYFEQEASFYILNKLNWKDGNKSKGEFIKINM